MNQSFNHPDELQQVTRLLGAMGDGKVEAEGELANVVYEHLKRIAQNRMREERKDHTLGATALVNEAWLRLRGDIPRGDWQSRSHFYKAAANAMGRILIDHARSKRAEKRGGKLNKVSFSDSLNLAEDYFHEDVQAIEDAIQKLEEKDSRVGQVVRLRFYSGLSIDEVAEALQVSRRTVLNDWSFARAWLYKELVSDLDK